MLGNHAFLLCLSGLPDLCTKFVSDSVLNYQDTFICLGGHYVPSNLTSADSWHTALFDTLKRLW